MKKIALVGTMMLVSGCMSVQKADDMAKQEVDTPVIIDATVMQPAIEVEYGNMHNKNTSDYILQTKPIILKPRVTEERSSVKVRRCCPEDKLKLEGTVTTIIPELPEVYVILANRTFSAMLKDTAEVFNQTDKVRIYVEKTKIEDKELPGGTAKGEEFLQRRLKNLEKVLIQKQKEAAEYVLKPTVKWYDTTSKKVPAIKYTIELKSKDGVKIGEWADIVHQSSGDRSWW